MAEAVGARGRPRLAGYAALAGLEARRALASGVLPLLAIGVALAWHAAGTAPAETGLDAGPAVRGLRREAAWAAALLLVAPVLTLRAAGTLARWRGGEGDWLGSRPTGRGSALAASWLGGWLAGLALLGVTALGVELALGPSPPTLAYAGRQDRAAARVAPGEAVAFALGGGLGEGARARVTVGAALGTDADVRARLVWRSADGAAAAGKPVDVLGRTRLEVDLPGTAGALEVRLESLGPGVLALLPGGLEVWSPADAEGRASLALLGRGALLLAAALALALGLGAFVGRATATAGTLALWLLASAGPHWLPAARLGRALGFVAEGRVPEPLGWASVAATAAVVALGLALARAGSASWRPGG